MSLKSILREERTPILIIIGCIILTAVSALVAEAWFLIFIPIIVCGFPIVREIVEDAKEHEISAESLVIMGIIGCVCLGEYTAAAEVAIIMAIGELLEDAVTAGTRSGMESLSRLKADNAFKLVNGEPVATPLEEVSVGDIIRIRPGENIPLDGVVVDGFSSIDKSIITGESLPVDASVGSEVFAGTTNMHGSIDVEVTKSDEDSTIARMTHLLENADAGKSRIVGTADRWAKYIIAGAAIMAVLTYAVTSDIYRALTIIVVFCPCAFVLATPTAIMATMGNMAKNGILLRNASAIETLAKVDTVVFDKTGTLTTGRMTSLGFTATADAVPDYAEGLAAALESRSNHPLAKTISECHEQCGTVTCFEDIAGKGIVGKVDGKSVAVGNASLMRMVCPLELDDSLRASEDSDAATVFVGIDGMTVGFFSLEDSVKDSSSYAVSELKTMGLKTIMLTGDNQKVGGKVAGTLGLDDVVCDCLPETKLEMIDALEKEHKVCMMGDGMNDAPSLKRSSVGISMGSIGNDLAVGASDIVFMNDDIGRMPGLMRLCRRALKTIYAGLTLSMTINIIGVILAMLGEIGPIAGAIIHNGGSFFVVMLAASVLWSNPWSHRTK